ncbi:hypothetical protein F5Y16DRAFT_81208 [Xylariaceae sp. FL0255]|nr:hypothetical protein F5Y16DRAFT_81208 [Xylariaceae sp. FL0255]
MNEKRESETSTIDIASIEKSFPVPPRTRLVDRKTLPPLPPLDEIEREAAVAAALEDEERKSDANSSRMASPVTWQMLQKGLPLPFGLKMQNLPQRSIANDDAPTPVTASTKRLSFTSIDPQRNLKYGQGKQGRIVLSPQPSVDPSDPLNWPQWKKNLNFVALLVMVAITGAMKTALVSVNSTIAAQFGTSYTEALVLTGVPLMLSALTGMASLMIAKIWGKRPVYLVSAMLVSFGSVLDIGVGRNLAQAQAARIFQGFGWGAFDTLVLGSILDSYFEHERESKITIYNAVSIAATWGAPLIGGAASSRRGGFSVQFEIFTPFVFVALLLIVFGAPETNYLRSKFDDEKESSSPLRLFPSRKFPTVTFSKEVVMEYIQGVMAWPYQAILIDRNLLLQAPKAAVAPSTLLLFVITLLPTVSLWGFTSALSLLFARNPFTLSDSSVGLLLVAPFVFASGAAIGLPMYFFRDSNSTANNTSRKVQGKGRPFTSTSHLVVLAVGTALAGAGTLAFGLYVTDSAVRPTDPSTAISDLSFPGSGVSFPVLSFLLGLIAVGHVILDVMIRPVVRESTAFTSANMGVALRNTGDMQAGLACLRAFTIGIFVLGLPGALDRWDTLRAAAIGLGVVQIVVVGLGAGAYAQFGQAVRRWDGSVMGLVDLAGLKSKVSFFDED